MSKNNGARVVLRKNELEQLHEVLNFYSQVYDGKLWNEDLDMLYERVLLSIEVDKLD